MTPVETERLFLRRPRLADIDALFTFLGDAEAMRFTHADNSPRACRRRVAVHEWRRRKDGCAPWTVVLKETGLIIGWGGLYDDPFDPGWGIEIGYYFHPDAWGQGFGRELVAAALHEADAVLGLAKVAAFARPENIASRRLLQRAGFAEIRYVPEMARLYFERLRPDAGDDGNVTLAPSPIKSTSAS